MVVAAFWTLSPSPEGVTLCFIILSTATIFLSYLVGKELGNQKIGLTTALLVAIHNLFVGEFWIWSPHLISFFTALSLLFLFKGIHGKKLFLYLATALSFFALHLHYSSLPIIPVVVMISFIEISNQWWKKRTRAHLFALLIFLAIFISGVMSWLMLSFKGSAENVVLFSSGASKSAISISFLLNNFFSNSHILFDPLFLLSGWNEEWLIFPLILLGLGLLAYFLYRRKRPFKNVLYILAFNMSFLFTCLFHSGGSYHYFTPFFLIFWLSLIILFFSFLNSWKIITVMKLIFILFIARNLLLDSYKNQIIWPQNSYQIFTAAADVIIASQKDDPNFTVFVYTSMGTTYPLWDSPAVWFPLEKKMHQSLVTIIPNYNNILPIAVKPQVGYTVCTHIFDASSQVVVACEAQIKTYLTSTGRDVEKMTFSKIDDHGSKYVILKVESEEGLPTM